jgi:hypothetical protein
MGSLKTGVLALVISAFSSSVWAATEIPAKVTGKQANIFVITLQVEGKERHFIIDTGCSISIFSPDVFKNALPLDSRETVTLLSSKAHQEVILVDLTIAGKRIREKAFRTDLSDVSEALATHIDGLIGQDVLSHFTSVTLNFKTHHLVLD